MYTLLYYLIHYRYASLIFVAGYGLTLFLFGDVLDTSDKIATFFIYLAIHALTVVLCDHFARGENDYGCPICRLPLKVTHKARLEDAVDHAFNPNDTPSMKDAHQCTNDNCFAHKSGFIWDWYGDFYSSSVNFTKDMFVGSLYEAIGSHARKFRLKLKWEKRMRFKLPWFDQKRILVSPVELNVRFLLPDGKWGDGEMMYIWGKSIIDLKAAYWSWRSRHKKRQMAA